jgi:hypothetical protein
MEACRTFRKLRHAVSTPNPWSGLQLQYEVHNQLRSEAEVEVEVETPTEDNQDPSCGNFHKRMLSLLSVPLAIHYILHRDGRTAGFYTPGISSAEYGSHVNKHKVSLGESRRINGNLDHQIH